MASVSAGIRRVTTETAPANAPLTAVAAEPSIDGFFFAAGFFFPAGFFAPLFFAVRDVRVAAARAAVLPRAVFGIALFFGVAFFFGAVRFFDAGRFFSFFATGDSPSLSVLGCWVLGATGAGAWCLVPVPSVLVPNAYSADAARFAPAAPSTSNSTSTWSTQHPSTRAPAGSTYDGV